MFVGLQCKNKLINKNAAASQAQNNSSCTTPAGFHLQAAAGLILLQEGLFKI